MSEFKNIKAEIEKYKAYKDNGILSDFGEELLKELEFSVELLEALKEMVSFAEFHGYTNSTEINNARQIINKATEL